MIETLLANHPWTAGLAWAIAYLLDWTLTIAGRRSYERLGGRFLGFEQYELNPILQKSVERQRFLSPRFVILWVVSSAIVGLYVWWTVSWGFLDIAVAVVGAVVLLQAVILFRHVRGLLTFGLLRSSDGAEGFIRYREWFSQRTATHETMLFGCLLLALAAVESSVFLLGGAVANFALGLRTLLRSNIVRARAKAPSTDEASGEEDQADRD
jgi:hypothetical protein